MLALQSSESRQQNKTTQFLQQINGILKGMGGGGLWVGVKRGAWIEAKEERQLPLSEPSGPLASSTGPHYLPYCTKPYPFYCLGIIKLCFHWVLCQRRQGFLSFLLCLASCSAGCPYTFSCCARAGQTIPGTLVRCS